MQLRKDFWRGAILGAPVERIVAGRTLDGWPLAWLPDVGPLRYLADPFGLGRNGRLHVFAELFDYRDARGRIAHLEYDADLRLVSRGIALHEAWHLSYPFVFEAEGETWLLPEAWQSGGAWLYRAVAFPLRWERAARIVLDAVPLDATPWWDGQLWWLFYAPAEPAAARLTRLHAAWAERIAGPWHPHPSNPILDDTLGCRPGGAPVMSAGGLVLPVQGCVGGYGTSLRLLRFDVLTPERIVARIDGTLTAPAAAAPFTEGCHTLAGAGGVTLIDVKRTRASFAGLAVRPLRALYARRDPADW